MSLDRYVHAISVARNLSSFGGASLSYFESGVSNIQGKDFNNESTGFFSSKNSYLMFHPPWFDKDEKERVNFFINSLENKYDKNIVTALRLEIGKLYRKGLLRVGKGD